jgi:hypothetical protein
MDRGSIPLAADIWANSSAHFDIIGVRVQISHSVFRCKRTTGTRVYNLRYDIK